MLDGVVIFRLLFNFSAGGFKLFFNEDKLSLMTPKQVLGLESVDGAKINKAPKFINYE